MRRLGFAVLALAAIPALAIPLLAAVVAISTPAALIAGIAAMANPSPGQHDGRAAPVNAASTTARP